MALDHGHILFSFLFDHIALREESEVACIYVYFITAHNE
jgi:hypothetical protein